MEMASFLMRRSRPRFTYLAAFLSPLRLALQSNLRDEASVAELCRDIASLTALPWPYDTIHVAVLALSSASSILDIPPFIFPSH